METIGIIGTGIMGTDIAHLAAESGFEVLIYDCDEAQTKNCFKTIESRLLRYVKEGRIQQNAVAPVISRIKIHKDIRNLKQADITIECVSENVEIKKDVFRQLDTICNPGCVLASNTSSISITEIASVTKRPESVIGMHFLIPARVMPIVELIPGLVTTRETVELAKTVIKQMGKKHAEAKDYPGFILNRTLFPMINEAITLLYEGAGNPESIDKILKLGLNLPMGPLALADMIGLDIVLAILEEMNKGYSDSKYRPCPLLKKYVSAGYLGQKAGRGFYLY